MIRTAKGQKALLIDLVEYFTKDTGIFLFVEAVQFYERFWIMAIGYWFTVVKWPVHILHLKSVEKVENSMRGVKVIVD